MRRGWWPIESTKHAEFGFLEPFNSYFFGMAVPKRHHYWKGARRGVPATSSLLRPAQQLAKCALGLVFDEILRKSPAESHKTQVFCRLALVAVA
jgi:hypothetical protein